MAVKSYPLPSYVKDNADKRYNLEGFYSQIHIILKLEMNKIIHNKNNDK